MRNKEMSMNDYRVMYAEYCLGTGASYATMAIARCFTKFVAWRKKERLLERVQPLGHVPLLVSPRPISGAFRRDTLASAGVARIKSHC